MAANFQVYTDGWFDLAGVKVRCALGKGGVRAGARKREGDGATPAGIWPIRRALYRPDRGAAPVTRLTLDPMWPHDGWCDAPSDDNYNQPVKLPYGASAETLWRTDHVYDRIIILGYNDSPVISGAGSAIFLHLARENYAPTEGCVALAPDDLTVFFSLAGPGDTLQILERPWRG